MSYELIIYCDESITRGRFYSNFYGGVLVSSRNQETVNTALNNKKAELHLNNEIKWQRVTENYLSKYLALMDVFFDFIKANKLKVRIMCTQNARVAVTQLDPYQREHEYFLLYYQFIKHAFGLPYFPKPKDIERVGLRLHFDRLPDTREKSVRFKSYIGALSKQPQFRNNGIFVRDDNIAEVDSADHVLMQCLDVVLGAMQFRLNDMHKEKPKGQRRRGKRTIAKEKLYKHIYARIEEIYPRFNIGVTTALKQGHPSLWKHQYRHWIFSPREYEMDSVASKRG
ncbi:MAG: DUF3800 domain-containing protein [Alphaproteobacteria bacterium]